MKISREIAEKIHQELLRAIQFLGEGKLEEAERLCHEILKKIPTHPDALQVLGLVESHRQNFDTAIAYFKKSLQMDPKQANVWVMLGNAYTFVRESEKAKDAFQQALNYDPKNSEAFQGLGMAALGKGDQKSAQTIFLKAIRANPNNAQPYSMLAKMKGFEADQNFIKKLETITGPAGQSKIDAIFAHYALANLSSRTKKKANFLHHLKKANELQTLLGPVFSSEEELVRASRRIFNKSLLQKQAELLANSITPIFLVGLPRSGSSLVEQILSCHEKVFAGDELLFTHSHLIPGVETKTKARYPLGLQNLTAKDWQAIGSKYLDRVKSISKDAPFVTDKLLTNLFHIGLIRMALPGAKVIYVRRNAFDTAFSIYSNYFAERMGYFCDLKKMAAHFRLVNNIMGFWKTLYPGFILELNYEDLVSDLEGQSRKILDFTGLDWDPACLEFHKSTRPVFTTSLTQVREPIYSSSIGKWKEYAELLEPFKAEISDLIDDAGFLKS